MIFPPKSIVTKLNSTPTRCQILFNRVIRQTFIARMSSSPKPWPAVQTTSIETAPGVTLDDHQKTLVGSVLDLFQGKATKDKLALWKDDAVFEDPICIAEGRKQYEAQWYGLAKAFSKSETEYHQVIAASPTNIDWDLHQRYTVIGLGNQVLMKSTVHMELDNGKISKVQDKWNGKLPDNSLLNFFRRANAVTMPHIVGPPKDQQ